MVAPSTDSPVEPDHQAATAETAARHGPPNSSHFLQMLQSLSAAARLQMQILTLRVHTTVRKLIMSLILSAAALVAALAGIVFFYMFFFHLLTDIAHMPVTWVWLIFTALHLVTAGALFLCTALLWKPAKSKTPEDTQ